jgi:site-specific DNA-cytosine methylase
VEGTRIGSLCSGYGGLDLAAVGYGLRWTRVQAADAGAPHLRERWFGLAWDADAAGDARRLEHGNDGDAADPDVVG